MIKLELLRKRALPVTLVLLTAFGTSLAPVSAADTPIKERRLDYAGTHGNAGETRNDEGKDRPFVNGVFMPIHWANLEPEPGVFDWKMFDEWVGGNRGILLMIWVGGHSPRWLCWDRQPKWQKAHPNLKYPLTKLEKDTYNGDPAYLKDAGVVFDPIVAVHMKGENGEEIPYKESNKYFDPWYTQGLAKDTDPNYDPKKSSEYEYFFRRMHASIVHHMKEMPESLRKKIVLIHTAEGPTGDLSNYKGEAFNDKYAISKRMWTDYKLRAYKMYIDLYGQFYPDVEILFSAGLERTPRFNFLEVDKFLLENVPNHWRKLGQASKGFNLSGELNDKRTIQMYNQPGTILMEPDEEDTPEEIALKKEINALLLKMKANGDYIRFRSGADRPTAGQGWFANTPIWSSYWLCINCLAVPLDLKNMHKWQFDIPENEEGFYFYNKYAGIKYPELSNSAFSALRFGLDVTDTTNFPEAEFGPVGKGEKKKGNNPEKLNIARAEKIIAKVGNGARVGDIKAAVSRYRENNRSKSLNDIANSVIRGNYEKFLTQYDPNGTSVGHWRVWAGEDPVKNPIYKKEAPTQPYGRWARGFEHASGKNTMYFDLADNLGKKRDAGTKYKVTVTYYDDGKGKWALKYDSKDKADKVALEVQKTDTKLWKKVSVTVEDAAFQNRCPNKTDLMLDSVDEEDDIFHMVEVDRI